MGKPRIVAFIKDSRGINMAFVSPNAVVVSRNYIWRGIVSIAERVLNEAIKRKLPVVLYIHNEKRFLVFDPERVFDLNDWNVRGGEKFYHIRADFGTMLEDSKVAKLEEFGLFEGSG